MTSELIKIALVSVDGEERKFYQSQLDPLSHIAVEPYKSLTQLKRESVDKRYSGVIIDMYTVVSASTEEKEFFFSMQEGLPVMQVRRALETGEIKGLINRGKGGGTEGARLFDSFVETHCLGIPPRGLRLFERKKILLQIHFFLSQGGAPVQSELRDLSAGGCFLVSPQAGIQEKNRIWITIDDLQDKNPITCIVRWKKDPLESHKEFIGIGAQFEKLLPEQQQRILEIIKSAR